MPVKLVGGRATTPFTLEVDETREMEPNYCLIEKLRLTWGLDIPELSNPGTDDSGIDIDGAFAAVRTAILRSNATSFHVEETAHLALLQFSTLEMWRDLSTNWASFMERPAVRHLVETAGQPFVDDIDVPAADRTAEATTYLPIPADGSQLEAVRWAAAGKSFILEGPPGTGKSQTITNLIAHLLAEGKKVLFVAEKPAALEVVKKRLDDVGLGAFSLDLHGRNQTVTAVREQLTAALDAQVDGASTWEALRSNYRGLVESLSRYPDQVHEEGPVGVSSWEARQVLLELQEIAGGIEADIDVPRALVMGATSLDSVYDAARNLGNALLDLGVAPAASPWRLAGGLDADALDRTAIAGALTRVVAADQAVTDPILRAMTSIARTPVEFEAIAVWLDSVRAGAGRSAVEAHTLVTPQWRAHAEQTMNAVAQFRATYGPSWGLLGRDHGV
ncbi:AAA domain-containing protein [Oerskovia sp. M15]